MYIDIRGSQILDLLIVKFLKANFNPEIYPQLYTPEIFYEACRNLQSFYAHQETSQNAKYSAIDKKKSHLNQEIKKLIKKNIFPELYNEQCNKIPSSSKDDNQKITWQNFKTSNSAYSKLCGKLSLFKSVPSRLIEKSAYCSTENMATNKFDVVFSYCGDNIKEFISRYFGAIIGVIVAIILLCTHLYKVIIGIILIFVCGYVGNYVQMNKEDVKEKLKNIIDRL